MTYLKSVNSQVDPAGCYWNHERMAIYNQIANPSQTNPKEFGIRGGVCMRYGKYQNNFKMTFKLVLLLACLPTFCVKCHSFLLLLDVYSETVQEYCDKNGNNRSFSELDTAKASCLTDGNCIGLYDECGRGSSFFHCSAPMAVRPSSCGSILYQQIGTQIMSI